MVVVYLNTYAKKENNYKNDQVLVKYVSPNKIQYVS